MAAVLGYAPLTTRDVRKRSAQVLLHMPGFATDLRSPRLERLRPLLPREGVWAGLRTTQDKLQRASQQQG